MEERYVESFLDHLRVDTGMCARTIDIYRVDLRHYLEYCAALGIPSLCCAQPASITEYYRILIERRRLSSHTAHQKAVAVYAFYEWLKRQGVILVNPCPKPPPDTSRSLPRGLPGREVIVTLYRKLHERTDMVGARDYAIIDLAYSGGLRRGELARLDVTDLCIEEGTIRVLGKGGHERFVPVGKKTLGNLEYYLYHIRPKFLKYTPTKALFVTAKAGGRRMGPRTINTIFVRHRPKCGASKTFTPHALRHAFATDLLRNGAPLQDVAKMLGHAALETTQIYTRVVPIDLKRIHKKCHPRG